MREITTHKTGEQDRQPQVFAMDHIGPGGAEQLYRVIYECPDGGTMYLGLDFVTLEQNGVTNEALLAIVIDRLEGFQDGPFACDENEAALNSLRNALVYLQERTRGRMARGVENQAKP